MPDPLTIPHRSDDDLQSLATVTDGDATDAAAYWREHAAEKYRELVDAEEAKS